MNKIKTIIIDDEPLSLKSIETILTKYCTDIEILATADSVDTAFELIHIHKPDLVFLDIELSGESGFDLLKLFSHRTFEVIFVTAYNQFGIDAVKAEALDYILKPVNKTELMTSVDKVVYKLSQSRKSIPGQPIQKVSSKIPIPITEGLLFAEPDDILYIESEGRYARFYLRNNTHHLVSKSIGEYEKELDKEIFVRLHHSYMVNVNHIEKYIKGRGGYVVLKNGKKIEVSARKKDDFLDSLGK